MFPHHLLSFFLFLMQCLVTLESSRDPAETFTGNTNTGDSFQKSQHLRSGFTCFLPSYEKDFFTPNLFSVNALVFMLDIIISQQNPLDGK